MRRGAEKIVISMGESGVWMYWNASDAGDAQETKDAGNIIDFVKKMLGTDNLGEIRKELRPWLSGAASAPSSRAGEFDQPLLPITKEKADMYARLASMQIISGSRYLNEGRHIPEHLTADPRFAGRIYQDQRTNAIFPHYNLEGVCGYEIKNQNFTGFSPGGSKGLWCSRITPEDTSLVIGEATIDVLSFAALHPDLHTRYMSTGGALNDEVQPELIKRAAAKMPPGAKIILAMDNDEAGQALVAKIKALISPVLAEGCIVSEKMPKSRGGDWNDALRALKPQTYPGPSLD